MNIMHNIYYNPQDFGLEVVGSFDWTVPDWSFDMLVVWKERRGRYWVGEDSGCSCPSPFENIGDINELDGPYTKEGLRKRLEYRIQERASQWTYPESELRRYAREILSRLS